MSVVAPPRLPEVGEPAGDDLRDALIKEARQRARRRRCVYAGALVLVAIAAVVAFPMQAGPPPPHAAAPEIPTPPTPLGAPLVQGPDSGSTLLASWGWEILDSGIVFVYADGRVIWTPLGGVYIDADGRMIYPRGRVLWDSNSGTFQDLSNGRVIGHSEPRAEANDLIEYPVLERRLSPLGLDLVRGGQLDATDFAFQPDIDRREDLWSQPTFTTFEPAKYAICATSAAAVPGATDLAMALPAPAQALLRGKQRIFDPNIGVANWSELPPSPLMECFELGAAETASLHQILDPNGATTGPPGTLGWFAGRVQALPIYPHGQPVSFGG